MQLKGVGLTSSGLIREHLMFRAAGRMSSTAKTVASPMRKTSEIFRTTLDSPFHLQWPNISAEDSSALLDEIKRSFTSRDTEHQKQDDAEPAPLKPKHKQLVVGIREVTRKLERDELRCGLVDVSVQPALLHHHLLMLAGVRQVPFVALREKLVPLLGMKGVKSVVAVGFKRLDLDESDHFSELVAAVTRLAPPIKIPWLTRPKGDRSRGLDKGQSAPSKYLPLKVKRTVVKTRKKRKK